MRFHYTWFHVTLRLTQDCILIRDATARRLAIGLVHQHLGPHGLLAYGFADDHLHFLILGDRQEVGQAIRRLELALRQVLGIPVAFERARIREGEGQRHLANAYPYSMRQPWSHKLNSDDFLEGSSWHELMGTRFDPSDLAGRLKDALPRVDAADYLSLFLDIEGRDPGSPATIAAPPVLDPVSLARGVEAATASLSARGPHGDRVRRWAGVLAAPDLPSQEVAAALGIGLRTVQRVRARRKDESTWRCGEASADNPNVRPPDLAGWRIAQKAALCVRRWVEFEELLRLQRRREASSAAADPRRGEGPR